MYLNANIPPIECYVRGNYLRDQKDSHDKYFECVVFGFTSIPKQVPLFHYMMTDGGIWWRAPISAFCKKPGVKELPLNELMLWDSFSYNISVTKFYQLDGCKMICTSRRKKQDPKVGTGKKPKGSGRRLYTDENQEGSYDYEYKEIKNGEEEIDSK